MIIEEGKASSSVVIVLSGQFEIIKRNLSNVYMNPVSGIILIELQNGKSIKSTVNFNDDQIK